jgi:AbrB family looped-hinge helix DNA binding protein
MSAVTVSPKYQVVIPKGVRESLKIAPGQMVQVIAYNSRIELVPVKPLKRMRGFLKGIETEVRRGPDRDL